jgi:hypothetical protein
MANHQRLLVSKSASTFGFLALVGFATACGSVEPTSVGVGSATEDAPTPTETNEPSVDSRPGPTPVATLEGARRTTKGRYTVAVPDVLTEYGTFDVGEVEFKETPGAIVSLTFVLPTLLTGDARRLAFAGALRDDGSAVLSGDPGAFTCSKQASGVTRCDGRLAGVPVDLEGVKKAASAGGLDASVTWKVIAVAERFSAEPLGTLTFER